MTMMDDLRTFAGSAEANSGVREIPGGGVQSFDLDKGLLLVVPVGAKPDREAVDRAVEVLRDTPALAAVIDLPPQKRESSLLLDLLIYPEQVGAVLLRSEMLAVCTLPVRPEGTLARAHLCVSMACGFEISRSLAPMASPAESFSPSDREMRDFTHTAFRAFAIDDLCPSLRSEPGELRIYELSLKCAGQLLQRGRLGEGFALGAWAEALVRGREAGRALDLDRPRPVVKQKGRSERLRERSADPLVSLILPTMDRPALLVRALESVAVQTFRDLEVIVVNDGGADPGSVLDAFRHTIGEGGRMTIIHHDQNRGLAAARNTGIRMARGRYVGFLDDDDRLLPHHVAALLPRLLLGARVVYADSRTAYEVPAHPLPYTSERMVRYQLDYDPETYPVENYFPVQVILLEKELILEAGGFDETLPVLEDWDAWMRVFQLAEPEHVRRLTSETRRRFDGSNMTAENRDRWSEIRGHIYGKTLDLERRDSGLRKRRFMYLVDRGRIGGGECFPTEAHVWFRGADGLEPIDPQNPGISLGGLDMRAAG